MYIFCGPFMDVDLGPQFESILGKIVLFNFVQEFAKINSLQRFNSLLFKSVLPKICNNEKSPPFRHNNLFKTITTELKLVIVRPELLSYFVQIFCSEIFRLMKQLPKTIS